MKKVRAFDLPHRILHWAIAVFFLISFLIAKNVDDESWIYALHMLSGFCLGFVVLLRLVWGVFGSDTARFKNLITSPKSIALYFRGLIQQPKEEDLKLGHNPASSFFAWVVFVFSLGLVATGVMMANDFQKETVEEVHELLANGFLIAVVGHVLGLIYHSIRYRDWLPFSMVHGNKALPDSHTGIPSQRSFAALGVVLLISAFVLFLKANYVVETGKLFQLQLGEVQESEDTDDSTE